MSAARGQIQVPSAARWLERNAIQTLAKAAPSYFANRLQNPCFLIGSPRSGTSFFDQVFVTHPSIVSYPSEALDLWHPNAYPWRSAAADEDFPPIWGNPEAFTKFTLSSRTPKHDQHLRASFGALARFSPKHQFVNKCTMIGLMLPHVIQVFPDARFIHIVRDGRASAFSWAKRQRQEIDRYPTVFNHRGWNREMSELLLLCAAAWKTIVDEIDAWLSSLDVGDHRWMRIRYEDFCENPRDVLASAARFLGLPPDGFVAVKCDSIASQNFKYQSELSETSRKQLAEMLEDTLSRLGYAESS